MKKPANCSSALHSPPRVKQDFPENAGVGDGRVELTAEGIRGAEGEVGAKGRRLGQVAVMRSQGKP